MLRALIHSYSGILCSGQPSILMSHVEWLPRNHPEPLGNINLKRTCFSLGESEFFVYVLLNFLRIRYDL